MITILKWRKSFKNFSLDNFLDSFSINLKDSNLEKLQIQQFKKGLDKEDRLIGTYKKITELISKKKPRPLLSKKAGKPYNLLWTGDLSKKTRLEVNKKNKDLSFILNSTSENKNKLFFTIKKHGLISAPEKTLFGFNKKNNKIFVNKAEKIYITNLYKILK